MEVHGSSDTLPRSSGSVTERASHARGWLDLGVGVNEVAVDGLVGRDEDLPTDDGENGETEKDGPEDADDEGEDEVSVPEELRLEDVPEGLEGDDEADVRELDCT